MTPDATGKWVITVGALVLIAISLGALVTDLRRERSALPFWVFAGAMLWMPLEPLVDVPMGLWHAEGNPWIAFHVLDRPVPLYVASVGSIFYIGAMAFYRLFRAGTPLRKMLGLMVVLGIVDYVFEMPSAQLDVVRYYGDNPSRIFGLPLYAMVQNIGVYAIQGWVVFVFASWFRGWRGALTLPALCSAYIAYAFGCTWPAYLAVQTSAAWYLTWPAIALSVALNAAVPYAFLRSRAVEQLRSEVAAGASVAPLLTPSERPVLTGAR